MNCFRYLDMKTFDEIDHMLLKEYTMRLKAMSLSRVDKERDLHWQAYLNMVVQSTKERGKKQVPVYPTFKSFFDYEKILNGTREERPKENEFRRLMLLANKEGG